MPGERCPRTDLRTLFDRVENAPPVEAVDVVAAELGEMFGAREVSFLITDFSGRALVRFNQVGDAMARGGREQGVTGQLMRIDLDSHTATIVNAGHPLPLRVREGRVDEVELAVDLPFGIRPGREFRLQKLPLQPGDRIAFVTEGMLERNAARLDVSAALTATVDLHPREVVHALGSAVLSATRGKLRDDAMVLCLDWYGGPRRPRDTSEGRASSSPRRDECRETPSSPAEPRGSTPPAPCAGLAVGAANVTMIQDRALRKSRYALSTWPSTMGTILALGRVATKETSRSYSADNSVTPPMRSTSSCTSTCAGVAAARLRSTKRRSACRLLPISTTS